MDRKEYLKKYKEEKKEEIRQKNKLYKEKNKEKIKEKAEIYYLKNKDILLIKKQKYYELNKENIISNNSKYYEDNIEKIKEYQKNYRENNKEYQKVYKKLNKDRINKIEKERKNTEPLYKLICNIRSLICGKIKSNGYQKETKTYVILGCSFEDFKIHLENQFTEWMNWDNYGNPKDGIFKPNKTWDIDHIIPLASATSEEEIIKLNHFTNLQPLCSYENRFVKKENY